MSNFVFDSKNIENVKILFFQVVPGPQTKEADALEDWASELRPSMRKLRQGMDSLCKTARLGKVLRNIYKIFSPPFAR